MINPERIFLDWMLYRKDISEFMETRSPEESAFIAETLVLQRDSNLVFLDQMKGLAEIWDTPLYKALK